MLKTVLASIEWHHLLPEGTLVVAVSGGADSLCMLHLLHQLCGTNRAYPDTYLHVAHLNHQLRGSAGDEDAAAVARIAKAWGLPITIGIEDVPALAAREHLSLEDAARRARYRFLRSVAQGQPIAIAHHKDDQVETLLLHWLRGGGITSMIGLQPRQQDIVRPLLTVSHADTLAYCAEHNLTPIEDASNSDTRFLRNRVRHELLPLLEEMNPGMRPTLLRTAEVMQVDAAWIETQVDSSWPAIVVEEQDDTSEQGLPGEQGLPLFPRQSLPIDRIRLRLPALFTLPLSLQRHLLRRVTAQLCAGQSPLELRHYKLIEQLMQRDKTPEQVTLHLPEHLRVIRVSEELIFERDTPEQAGEEDMLSEPLLLPVPGQIYLPGATGIARADMLEGSVLHAVRTALSQNDWTQVWAALSPTPYVVYIDGASVSDTLIVRGRQPGDRMRPLGMTQEKKVQDILVDKHVARAERQRIPLFCSQEHCIWLAGICIDDRVRLTARTQRIIRLSLVDTSR
jgi:tRNA(Ile)-lysidine synthase